MMEFITWLAGLAPELLAWASVLVIFYVYRNDVKEDKAQERQETKEFAEALTKFSGTLDNMNKNLTRMDLRVGKLEETVQDCKKILEDK